MQVKKIYMDLKEASPEQRGGRDVWVLESEAFKDPITLEIEFDKKDENYLEGIKQSIELQLNEAKRVLALAQNTELEIRTLKEEYRHAMNQAKEEIEAANERTKKAIKEKSKVLQETKELRELCNKLNEQVKALQCKHIDLEQKVTKEPRVFSGQTFVSGNGMSALTAITIPDGNYIVSEVFRIVEKNEYVENEDMEVHAYNLHVSNNLFTPEYELRGTTKLDTPTATIDRTFTLLPY